MQGCPLSELCPHHLGPPTTLPGLRTSGAQMRPQSPGPSKQTYVQFSKVVGPQSILKYLKGEGSWRVEFEKNISGKNLKQNPLSP